MAPVNEASRFEKLPPLTLEEAAWLAGVTPEAMGLFLDNGGLRPALVEKKGVALLELVRIGYSLLSQKETQLEMMRLLLDREPDLSAASARPEPVRKGVSAPSRAKSAPASKGAKREKKKK